MATRNNSCEAWQRKRASDLVREIRQAARRGDCFKALQLLSTNAYMGASKCMRVRGNARVHTLVRRCFTRYGESRARRGF